MGGELQELKKYLKKTYIDICAIKAKGGHVPWRELFRMTDKELNVFELQAEDRFRTVVLNLYVAEAMLQEPAPSIHPRWEEYQQRQAEAVKESMKK